MAEPAQSQVTTRKDSALILRQKSGGRHGVGTESGSDRVKADSNNRDCQDYYPVATALGTDLIRKLGHYFPAEALESTPYLLYHCSHEIRPAPLVDMGP